MNNHKNIRLIGNTMNTLSQIKLEKLLSDKNFGAGNFLHKLIEVSDNLDTPLLMLDIPYRSLGGKEYTSMNLTDLHSICSEFSSFYYNQGVTAKDVVGIYLDDGIDYLIQFIALNSLGAISAFVNSDLSAEIAAKYLQRLNIIGIYTSKKRLDTLLGSLEQDREPPEKHWIREELTTSNGSLPHTFPFNHSALDPVLLTHTSGTTGLPKAVQASHIPYIHGVKFRLDKEEKHITRYLSALPHSHNSGIAYMMESLIRGCPLRVQTSREPLILASSIEKFKPDFVIAFPKQFVDMCRINLEEFNLNSVFYWRSTGDAAHERHVSIITQYGSHENEKGSIERGSIYIDGLGSSEMGSSLFTIYHNKDSRDFDRGIGKPQPWVEAQVLDDEGKILDNNQVGRLGIKSPSLTLGYWNNSNMTEKSRVQGYWITGDLVYRDTDGFFYHIDRITDKIETSNGILYSLQAEELIMKKFNNIFDCTIYEIDLPDSSVGAVIRVELFNVSQTKVYLESLLVNINVWLNQNGLPSLSSIIFPSKSDDYVPQGITGKVLKRILRNENEQQEFEVETIL
jgi:long-chain acyl-CoA synthetase